jgi:rfaE bifunctional protein kinase chain/domain
VVVDPKGVDYQKYRGATVVKPNQTEAGTALNRALVGEEAVAAAGRDLVALLGGATAVLVTRGPHGMTLFRPGRPAADFPARAREVYDVTGAGDTVTGAIGIALAAGVSLPEGCHLAAAAAAVVVGKLGTAAIDACDLSGHVLGAPVCSDGPWEGRGSCGRERDQERSPIAGQRTPNVDADSYVPEYRQNDVNRPVDD